MKNWSSFLGQVSVASHSRLASHRHLGATQVMTDVDDALLGTAQAAVIDFSMNGCVPCIQYKPVFDEVASQLGRDILMASVNIDDSPTIAARYGIRATPTTLFLATGNELNRIEGKMTKEELIAQITTLFGISPSAPMVTQPQASAPSAPQQAPYAPSAPGAPAAASSRPSKALLVVGGLAIIGLVTGGLLLAKA